jgi:MFS family permease
MAQDGAAFQLRSLTMPVYLPTFLFAVGQGAVIPVIPLFARDNLGASVAVASLVVALRGYGTMAFDIPAGLLVSRVGERMAMVLATLVLGVVALGAALSPTIWTFAPLMVAMGCGWAVWLLARLSYVTELAPLEQRGRALSLLGGANRIGVFVGPFLGGFAASSFGLGSAFYIQAALSGLACVALFAVAQGFEGGAAPAHGGGAHRRLGKVLAEHQRVFLTAGVAAMAIGVLRASRQAVIPLWGAHVGLSPGEIGVIFGLSSAIDMTLFYPVGIVMDRWGRKWVAVPCLLTMVAGMILIPATGGFLSLLGASMLTSFGNGLGSGIVMTLGADFSPATGRGEFLGVWRVIGDIGTAGGPTIIAAVSAIGTLGAASVVTGGLGLAGAAVMAFLVAEPLRRKELGVRQPGVRPPPG